MKIYISIPWKHRSRVNCYKKYCISVFYFIALKVPNGLWTYGAKMEVMFFTNLLRFEYQFLWCGDKVCIVKQLKFKQSTYLRPGNHTQKFFFQFHRWCSGWLTHRNRNENSRIKYVYIIICLRPQVSSRSFWRPDTTCLLQFIYCPPALPTNWVYLKFFRKV